MARPVPAPTRAALARLWRGELRPHRATLAVILVLVLVGAGATSLYPLLIKRGFEAFAARDLDLLAWAPPLVVLITAAKGAALYGQTVLTNRVVSRVEADLQSALYAALIDADLARLAREGTAELTQRFTTDFAFIKEALTRLVTVFLRDVATIIGLVGAMLWIDWQLTLIAGAVAPFVAPPIARIGSRLRRNARLTQEGIGAMAGVVADSLGQARVAKAYRLEGYLKARARERFEEVRRLRLKGANARARLDPLLEVGAGLAVAAVFLLVGRRIASGAGTLGDFTGFVTALLIAAQPIRALGNLNAIVQEAMAALERLFAVLDERPAIADRPGAAPLVVTAGAVRFEGARFRYRADQPALEGVDLACEGGRTTALVGRSGSGKTTLLSLVPRLIDVEAGRVTIDGRDLRDVTLGSLRASVAVVTQEAGLFDDTVAANIRFGRPGASDAEVEAAARAAHAHEFVSRLPEGYGARVGERGSRLSGGERQRVALARAVLMDAPILLLDEATSALDAESEALVQAALERLKRGRTTIVIAHRLATVRDADRIAVLDEGVVVEVGTHEELLARAGLYAALHRTQFREAGPAMSRAALPEAAGA